jgi:hypothetical protein
VVSKDVAARILAASGGLLYWLLYWLQRKLRWSCQSGMMMDRIRVIGSDRVWFWMGLTMAWYAHGAIRSKQLTAKGQDNWIEAYGQVAPCDSVQNSGLPDDMDIYYY